MSLKEKQKIADLRSIDFKMNRIRLLEAKLAEKEVDCDELQGQVETLRRENERLRVLLREEVLNE